MKFKDIDKIKVAISEMLYLKYKNKNHSLNGHVKIIGYQFGAKFKLVFCAKYERTWFRLLGNIETFEMDKYYKLFPDLVEKIH